MDASKHGRNARTAVFVQKGSTLKVMEEFNIQGMQTSFYKHCPGTFGYTLVLRNLTLEKDFKRSMYQHFQFTGEYILTNS